MYLVPVLRSSCKIFLYVHCVDSKAARLQRTLMCNFSCTAEGMLGGYEHKASNWICEIHLPVHVLVEIQRSPQQHPRIQQWPCRSINGLYNWCSITSSPSSLSLPSQQNYGALFFFYVFVRPWRWSTSRSSCTVMLMFFLHYGCCIKHLRPSNEKNTNKQSLY